MSGNKRLTMWEWIALMLVAADLACGIVGACMTGVVHHQLWHVSGLLTIALVALAFFGFVF